MQTDTSASTSKAGAACNEPPTSCLVLSTLGAYSELTKHLFSIIENPSLSSKTIVDASAGKMWNVNDITGLLSALQEVDQLFNSRLEIAHQHAINQRRIEALQEQAKRRDRETRQAILELSRIQSELAEMARLSEEEVASIEKAEKQPIGHSTLLGYAQRLARYTSAPPGYKLPRVASAAATQKDDVAGVKSEQRADGEPVEQISLGADYNQYAKRAAAYYDPAIPSMPQEMPFPSDAMMRQGILNSQQMLDGAAPAEQPADETMDDSEELPLTDFAASYSHLRQQQQRHDEEDEDAFDLDLN